MQERLLPPASFTWAEFRAWLTKNGLEPEGITAIDFVSAASGQFHGVPVAAHTRIYMRVTRNCRDENGQMFTILDNGDDVIASETALLPVLDLPGE